MKDTRKRNLWAAEAGAGGVVFGIGAIVLVATGFTGTGLIVGLIMMAIGAGMAAVGGYQAYQNHQDYKGRNESIESWAKAHSQEKGLEMFKKIVKGHAGVDANGNFQEQDGALTTIWNVVQDVARGATTFYQDENGYHFVGRQRAAETRGNAHERRYNQLDPLVQAMQQNPFAPPQGGGGPQGGAPQGGQPGAQQQALFAQQMGDALLALHQAGHIQQAPDGRLQIAPAATHWPQINGAPFSGQPIQDGQRNLPAHADQLIQQAMQRAAAPNPPL